MSNINQRLAILGGEKCQVYFKLVLVYDYIHSLSSIKKSNRPRSFSIEFQLTLENENFLPQNYNYDAILLKRLDLHNAIN